MQNALGRHTFFILYYFFKFFECKIDLIFGSESDAVDLTSNTALEVGLAFYVYVTVFEKREQSQCKILCVSESAQAYLPAVTEAILIGNLFAAKKKLDYASTVIDIH